MPEQPQGPSKTEQKAQKKHDRHTLNMLKLLIQPIMDQIKLKYRKFRTPAIEDSKIAYLYDEQNPNVLTTDLNPEEAQHFQNRPFELAADDKGVTGLRETATNKFYYNLEIVTIEQRLSNGYYKRPKDFLADIKRLAKDARVSGDPEKTLKANEMVANVEVDMTTIETAHAPLMAELEAVSDREQAREAGRLAKEKQATIEGREVPTIVPNVPPHVSNTTTDQSSGPVHLGEDIPGQRHIPQQHFVTPLKYPVPGSLSNGFSGSDGSHGPHSNGSTVPSRPNEDIEMTDSQDMSALTNPQEHAGFLSGSFHTPSRPNTQHTTYTQTSAHTQMVPGSQPKDYHNSASTTTSGHKTSDRSNRDSGPYSAQTNGSSSNNRTTDPVPEFDDKGGSQIPDTQPEHLASSSQSNPNSSGSQSSPPVGGGAMGPPLSQPHARQTSNLRSLLNVEPTDVFVPVRPDALEALHATLATGSSGLSVEQLEQVMAALMESVWQTKGVADRNEVVKAVGTAFRETVEDIMVCQGEMEEEIRGSLY